jgi:CheY-like chemotaxis protein
MAKLLIVDDDQAMLRLYRARFPEGWELIPTDEPEQTLALALEHKPDAILLDLMMPNRLRKNCVEREVSALVASSGSP